MIMKKQFPFLFIVFLTGCHDSSYKRIRQYIDTIQIVDSHEHLHAPADSTDFNIFNTAYFSADIHSAGAASIDGWRNGKFNVDTFWEYAGKYYNYSRGTSYHEQMMHNLRILYGYDKPYLVKDDIQGLFDKMYFNHYRNYSAWFDKVFRGANFKTMLLDQYWNRFNTRIDTNYFQLVCNIHECVSLVGEAAANKKIKSNIYLLKLMNQETIITKSLDDYTNLIDSVMNIFKRNGAVCIKNTLAYYRTLDFEDVNYADASKIFNKTDSLNEQEKKKLEDFVFHHIIKQSIKLNLPIQMHTGYLAGLGGRIDNGHPMKLVNLFIQYPKARFMLFHGGYPWTGDFVALGKQFSNVYLDLVWLPQLSKTAAIRTLHEMLDAVPYNKILWGGDVSRIDDTVGSLELGKEVVATVLSERVDKGWMTKELAFDIAKSIFHDNAIELFHLKLRE
jgi:uncharacterized protein